MFSPAGNEKSGRGKKILTVIIQLCFKIIDNYDNQWTKIIFFLFVFNFYSFFPPHLYFSVLSPGVGNLSLVSSPKNPMITFQDFVVQVAWKTTRLLLRSFVLHSDFRKWIPDGAFGSVTVISGSVCSYWLLYAALLSDRWCHYKLIGCPNK